MKLLTINPSWLRTKNGLKCVDLLLIAGYTLKLETKE